MEKMSMLPKGSMGSELHEMKKKKKKGQGIGSVVQCAARDF